MGESPRDGIFRILIESLFCMVFVHLIKRWIPGVAKKTSPLVICSKGEKARIECGTKLEILKNEKYAVRYKALKICPIHIVSHTTTIACNKGMSMIFFNVGAYGLLSLSDRWKYAILGSKNAIVGSPYRDRFALTADT